MVLCQKPWSIASESEGTHPWMKLWKKRLLCSFEGSPKTRAKASEESFQGCVLPVSNSLSSNKVPLPWRLEFLAASYPSHLRPVDVQFKHDGLRSSHFTCRVLEHILDQKLQNAGHIEYLPTCWATTFGSLTPLSRPLRQFGLVGNIVSHLYPGGSQSHRLRRQDQSPL